MGAYLTEPVTHKEFEAFSDADFECCTVSMQGWRIEMEDAHILQLNLAPHCHCFAVFDGHGGIHDSITHLGNSVSQFLKRSFVTQLTGSSHFQQGDYVTALEHTFLELDQRIQSGEVKNSFVGSTAVVALIVDRTLYVANLGDSRCLLQRDDEVMELTKDHVPSQEVARIVKAGGFVDEKGRLNGTLAVSRAFGVSEFKSNAALSQNEQLVVPTPEVRKLKLSKDDTFLFLGCDGMFELLNSHKIMQFIEQRLAQKEELPKILDSLLDQTLAKDTQTGYGCDNMTAMIIKFK